MAETGFSMLDPLQLWRDALTKWEGGTNAMTGKELGSPEFARALHAMTGATLGLQQALGKANGVLLKELNLPSRSDLVAIGERLQRVEDLLEQLVRQGATPRAAARKAGPMPPRTRTPAVAAPPPSVPGRKARSRKER